MAGQVRDIIDAGQRAICCGVCSLQHEADIPGCSAGPLSGLRALDELGVTLLVVHTSQSAEPYHDFKHPEKFTQIKQLEKVYEDKGDIIYRLLR